MKIKRSSWHYQLLTNMYTSPPPPNLCVYFWKIVASMPLALFVILALFMVVFMVVFIMLLPALQFFVPVDRPTVFAGGFLDVCLLTVALSESIKDRTARRKKEHGVFASWLIAKKNGVCPRIDFE